MSNPNRIREWRKRKKLTLEQLAEASGMSPSFLSRIESGERRLTVNQLPTLARALGVHEYQLIGLNDYVPVLGELDGSDCVEFYNKDDMKLPFGPSHMHRITRPCAQGEDITAAIYNNGVSIGRAFKEWMIYFNMGRSFKISNCLNRICVIELDDGSNWIKILNYGREANRYDLESQTQPTIRDQAIKWATPVIGLMPPFIVGDFVDGVDRQTGLPM